MQVLQLATRLNGLQHHFLPMESNHVLCLNVRCTHAMRTGDVSEGMSLITAACRCIDEHAGARANHALCVETQFFKAFIEQQHA